MLVIVLGLLTVSLFATYRFTTFLSTKEQTFLWGL